MEKENYSQLELFSQTETEITAKKTNLSSSLLRYIRSYEKIILLIIGFIIASIISFSLGVEKGEKNISLNTNSKMDLAATKTPIDKNRNEEQIVIIAPQKNTETKETDKNKEETNTYTIQVASYQTKVHAQKEIEGFKKRGFSASIVSKGKYTVICVGKFQNKKTAESLLTELRKQYKDCFIRRL